MSYCKLVLLSIPQENLGLFLLFLNLRDYMEFMHVLNARRANFRKTHFDSGGLL